MEFHPEETLGEVLQRGIDVFKNTIQGVSEMLRVGDSAIKDLDDAMRGKPIAPGETPEETFLNVIAMIRGAVEEARETGSAAAPAVVQRAREALNRVTTVEPSWRVGPSVVKTAGDMFRMALRDLRGSDALIKLATGRGELGDLDQLIDWADSVTGRLDQVQRVIAEPKRRAEKPPEKPPERPQQPQGMPQKAAAGAKPKGSRKTKKKANPDDNKVRDVIFGAFAEVTQDPELKAGADKVAQGQMPPDQYVDGLIARLEGGQINPDMVGRIKEMALQNGADPNHVLMHDFFPD